MYTLRKDKRKSSIKNSPHDAVLVDKERRPALLRPKERLADLERVPREVLLVGKDRVVDVVLQFPRGELRDRASGRDPDDCQRRVRLAYVGPRLLERASLRNDS